MFLPIPLPEAAAKVKLAPAELESRLAPMREKIYQVRLKRKQPLLDTKVITSWNALMIRALAYGGKIFAESRYVEAAAKAAEFLLGSHRTPDGGLFRTSRDGAAKYHGFLDDYSFLAQALLALFDATGSTQWKDRAGELAATMTQKFGDPDHGGFYFTEKDAADLIIRQKTASDSPLPSGNAVAAMALLDLGNIGEARRAVSAFAQQVESQGEGMGSMVQAALLNVRKNGGFTVSTKVDRETETRPSTPGQLAEQIVATTAQWQSPTDVIIHVSIKPAYHINAHSVPPELSLIPTRLASPDDPSAEVDYPAGEELQVGFADRPLRVYSGDIQIRVRFSQPRQSGPPVALSLVYQACDEMSCLPAVNREIMLESDGNIQ